MKTKPNFMLRNVAGKDIVVAVGAASMDFNGIITLNETGAFLWKILEQGATYDELVEKMSAEYEADKDEIKSGIDEFIKIANDAKLLDM